MAMFRKLGLSAGSLVVFAALLEAGARLFFHGPLAGQRTILSVIESMVWEEPPFFVEESRAAGKVRFVTNPETAGTGTTQVQRFAMPRDPGTFRIFCVGESAVQGAPYMDEPRKAFPFKLEQYLRRVRRDTEVINAGRGSSSSGQHLKRVAELARYDPSLIVLYAGHNEYGYYFWQPEVLKISPWRLKLDLLLEKSFFYRLLLRMTGRGLSPGHAPGEVPVWRKYNTLAEMESYKRTIPGREWELFARNELALCEKTFELNLSRMASLLKERKIPFAVATLVSNLRDFPPVFNFHSPALTGEDLKRWERLDRRARSLIAQREPRQAVKTLLDMTRLDPDFAETYFLLGKTCYGLGDYARARGYFILAKDHSPAYSGQQRAPSSMNELIRGFCARNRVPLLDVERAFYLLEEGHGVPGHDLFVDNIHLNEQGYGRLAEAVGKALLDAGVVPVEGRR